jgi:heme/copper-type cytochrome/quinol oxidase subunit 4
MITRLQTVPPFSLELFLILLIAVIQVVLPTVIFIYLDARDRNSSHAIAWAAAALFGGIAVWILYFVVREEVGPGDSSATADL